MKSLITVITIFFFSTITVFSAHFPPNDSSVIDNNSQQELLQTIKSNLEKQIETSIFKLETAKNFKQTKNTNLIDSAFVLHEKIKEIQKLISYYDNQGSSKYYQEDLSKLIENINKDLLNAFDSSYSISKLIQILPLSSSHIEIAQIYLLETLNSIYMELRNEIDYKVPENNLIQYTITTEDDYVVNNDWYIVTIKVFSNAISTENIFVEFNKEKHYFKNGEARIQFKVNEEGGKKEKINNQTLYKKLFNAEIKLTNKPNISIPIFCEYYIISPVIQIQSGVINNLYKDCKNKMHINVPQFKNRYNPTFKISDQEKNKLINENKIGVITIIPETDLVELYIFQDSLYLGKETFKVKEIPNPNIIIKAGLKDLCCQIHYNDLKKIKLYIKPNDTFVSMVPYDASYKLKQFKVIITRNSKELYTYNKNYTTPLIVNKDLLEKVQPGDKLTIEILKLQRRRFDGKKVDVILDENKFHYTIVE